MAATNVEFVPLESKYKYKYNLGEGTGGQVIKVQDSRGRTYALKLMLYRKNERVLSAFNQSGILEEVTIANILNHPNIVKYDLIELLEYKDKRYISVRMPAYNENLEQYFFQSGRIEDPNLYFQLASAVAECTSKNVLHGDIKTYNIFVDKSNQRRPQLVLGDFGLSQTNFCIADSTLKTIYSLYERPPEIFLLEKYKFNADVWALGVVFYSMYTGKLLFSGTDPVSVLDSIFSKRGDPREHLTNYTDSKEWKYYARQYKFKRSIERKRWKKTELTEIEDDNLRDLLDKMLTLNPDHRIDIFRVLEHPFFKNVDKNITPSIGCSEKVMNSYKPNNEIVKKSLTRNKLVNTMFQIGDIYKISPESTFFSVDLFDRLVRISPDKNTRLYRSACLLIGTSLRGDSDGFVKVFKYSLKKFEAKKIANEEIDAAAIEVLQLLNWNVNTPTIYDLFISKLDRINDKTGFIYRMGTALLRFYFLARNRPITNPDAFTKVLMWVCTMYFDDPQKEKFETKADENDVINQILSGLYYFKKFEVNKLPKSAKRTINEFGIIDDLRDKFPDRNDSPIMLLYDDIINKITELFNPTV